jgi:hypothetical protein
VDTAVEERSGPPKQYRIESIEPITGKHLETCVPIGNTNMLKYTKSTSTFLSILFFAQGNVMLNNELNKQQYTNVGARSSLDLGSLSRSDQMRDQSATIGASALASQLLQHQQQVLLHSLT